MHIEPTSRRIVRFLAVGVLVVLPGVIAACTDEADAASPVLATTTIWADVTSRVACDEVEVASMIPSGVDAHEYEPSVADADALRGASVVVVNGLGLEERLHDALDSAEADGVQVVEVGPSMQPLSTDPHVWMDPDRVALAVPVIAAALQGVEDLGLTEAQIDRCAQEYLDELDALSAEMDNTLAVVPADRRRLVSNHEALGYFADRFDFEVIGAVLPSTSSLAEANPRDLDELEATMRANGVTTIFAETTAATALADALAERLGTDASVVELHTEALTGPGEGAATYLEMMRTNAELVAGALAGGQ